MKLGIIGGAGLLGSTTAFLVGIEDIVQEIKLTDLNENLLEGHVMDMKQAVLPVSKTKIISCKNEDLHDCDIILITASLPERKTDNRNEYLQDNLKIVKSICNDLKKFDKEKIVITCTNPIDAFNYVNWKLLGWDRRKLIGFSLNDTLRMKWAVSNVIGKDYHKLDGLCIGEHGDGHVCLFDQMTYDNRPLELTEEEKKEANKLTADWFRTYQELDCKRTTGWTSAVNLAKMIKVIVTDSKELIPCSTILLNEYDYEGLSMGMPVILGKNGVEDIRLPELTKMQRENLDNTASKIKALIELVV